MRPSRPSAKSGLRYLGAAPESLVFSGLSARLFGLNAEHLRDAAVDSAAQIHREPQNILNIPLTTI